MNAGKTLNEIICTVKVPQKYLMRPYLQPVYDEPEFIVRNIWRLYGGWYDGNPAHLKPGSEIKLAQEISSLAGGAETLVTRAEQLMKNGDIVLASHLVTICKKFKFCRFNLRFNLIQPTSMFKTCGKKYLKREQIQRVL